MSRPDVALITPYPPAGERHAGSGGVSSYSANLARAMTASGAEVTVIAPFEPGSPLVETDDGIVVHRAFASGPRALPRAAHAALETGARVVHMQHEIFLYGDPSWLLGLPLGLKMLRGAGAGPVVTMHQVVHPADVDTSFTRLHRVRVPAPLARAGIASVQASIRRLARTTLVHERSFVDAVPGAMVIPHGVELVTPPDRNEARAHLRLDDRPTVLCFGYLAPYKGLELALGAAQGMSGEINLVVAGGEHPRLAERNGYGRELEARYGDAARFTGYVAEADVARWFTAADIALLPYPKPFSSSGALALALAYGTPLLLSNELADASGASRSLATSLDRLSLRERLRGLTSDDAQLDLLRRESQALAYGRSWPSVARRHLDVYEEVSNAPRTTGRRFRAA
jgi:glycosyltransferase involved in cell wall biosynthesis